MLSSFRLHPASRSPVPARRAALLAARARDSRLLALLAGIVLLSISIAVPVGAAEEGPLLSLPMAEGKGDLLTDAVGGRQAAVTGGAWVTNRHRAALRFDGRATVAELADGVPALSDAFTVALWYRAERAPDPVGLVILPSTLRLLLYPTGRKHLVEVTGAGGKRAYGVTEATVRPGAWQHVALTYAPGAGVRLFVDGVAVYTVETDVGVLAKPTGPLRVGLGVNPAQRRYFRGMMAGFRLWGRALSEKEVAEMREQEEPTLASAFRGLEDLLPREPGKPPIEVGGRKQLFIDDRFIESSKGVALRMNPPRKMGVVLLPEKPWERKSIGFCASVMEYEGVFRLYYRADNDKAACVCLATSKDGVRWERPNLGVVEFAGSKENNIVFSGVGEAVVFLDPHGRADERFKMIVMQRWPDPKKGGLYCHTSPDGIRWKPGPHVLNLGPDTANQAAWDSRRGKYVAYVRKWDPLRKFGRIEMDDVMKPWPYTDLGQDAYFIWGKDKIPVPSREMPTAFGYDEEDPVESDHYNPAVVEYPYAQDAYFSFPSPYLHFPTPPVGKYHNDGLLDIQMALSRDGVEFRRLERAPYVSLGLEGERDSKCQYMAVGLVRSGSHLYQYYGGYDTTHGADDTVKKERPIGSLCGVRQRLDGFVSADAAYSGGEILTPPIRFSGKCLVLNIDTSAMGACRVGLLDAAGEPIPGFEADACDAIHGNDTARGVSWDGREDVSALAGKSVRLHFVLRAAKLYAFQFE